MFKRGLTSEEIAGNPRWYNETPRGLRDNWQRARSVCSRCLIMEREGENKLKRTKGTYLNLALTVIKRTKQTHKVSHQPGQKFKMVEISL